MPPQLGRSRRVASVLPFAIALSIWSVAPFAAEPASKHKSSLANQRDLQGTWTGGTLTPMERPPELAGKSHFAAAELEAQERRSLQQFWDAGHKAGDVGRDNDAFLQSELRLLPSGQTSLVIDPPDGRVPLRPEAEQARDFNLSNFDSYETMSQFDRCITRAPTAMLPAAYNNAYQIVQTRTHVLIVSEMVHDVRIIPLDGSAHIDARVRAWYGDSRGHWEGATLVVDTTNFNERGWIATTGYTGRMRGVPYSKNLHMVERFTRLDADTLRYDLSIDDPSYYRTAWKMSFTLGRDDHYQMFEYACHEDNQAVESILRGARAQEKSLGVGRK